MLAIGYLFLTGGSSFNEIEGLAPTGIGDRRAVAVASARAPLEHTPRHPHPRSAKGGFVSCVRRSVGAHSSQAVRSVTAEKRRVKRRAGARRLEPC